MTTDAYVVPSPDVLDLLLRLVDKSLVLAEPTAEGADRYRLLETLRQYAREKLQMREEATEIYTRHARYFMHQAEELVAVEGLPTEQRTFVRLAPERDNLRSAFQWFVDVPDRESAARMSLVLEHFLMATTSFTEARGWLECAIAMPTTLSDATTAKLLDASGILADLQGDYSEAVQRHCQAVEVLRGSGDSLSLARSLVHLAVTLCSSGNNDAARSFAAEALALAREKAAPTADLAWILRDNGIVALMSGDLTGSTRFLEESLGLADEANGWYPQVRALTFLGRVALHCADYEQAKARAREALMRIPVGAYGGYSSADPLDILAIVAAGGGKALKSTRLLSAAFTMRGRGSWVRLAFDQALFDKCLAELRNQLPAEVFAAAWAEGQAMQPEQAIAYALEENGA